MTKIDTFEQINKDIINCELCPRLRAYCKKVAIDKRASFKDQTYWGRPAPNFNPKGREARLVIVGLAPAAHGANRTGRMFTGDRSGEWLYRALYRAGFASQPSFEHASDGLELINCVITAVAHCAPPDNKPLPEEIDNCSDFFSRTYSQARPRVVVALGAIAWRAIFSEFKKQGQWKQSMPPFGHQQTVKISEGPLVIGSYHPSQQNTFTKRLTEPMFDAIFAEARKALALIEP